MGAYQFMAGYDKNFKYSRDWRILKEFLDNKPLESIYAITNANAQDVLYAVRRISDNLAKMGPAIDIINRQQAEIERLKEQLAAKEAPAKDTPVTDSELLKKPLRSLGLSTRPYNLLAKVLDLDTVGQVVRLSEKELRQTKSVGKHSIYEIKEALHRVGLKLREEC